uniref:Ig-like domain-containing protein n=1 Tax=Denticeps clupeoides TaxID=299321 RepID=A0AAY4C1G8_9TELE
DGPGSSRMASLLHRSGVCAVSLSLYCVVPASPYTMAALFFWFLAGLETLSSGAVGRFWIYGYNQRDIMHVDLEEEGVAARSDAGSFMVEERRSKLYFKSKEMRLMRICSAVQTVFSLSNSSLSRVSLAGEEGRRYLACTVRGFYPNVIRVRWVHRGKKVFFGTTTTGLLPQKDGTFQITNYLMLENGTAESFFCETEHVSIEGKLKLRLGGSIQKKKSLSGELHDGVISASIICWFHQHAGSRALSARDLRSLDRL